MATINRVVLVGNLTRDPELRSTHERHEHVPAARRLQRGWRNRDTGEFDERAELLRRDGVRGERRGLRALPRRRAGRSPSTAGSNGSEWQTAEGETPPGGRDHRRQRPVPRRAPRDADDGDAAEAEEEEVVAF